MTERSREREQVPNREGQSADEDDVIDTDVTLPDGSEGNDGIPFAVAYFSPVGLAVGVGAGVAGSVALVAGASEGLAIAIAGVALGVAVLLKLSEVYGD